MRDRILQIAGMVPKGLDMFHELGWMMAENANQTIELEKENEKLKASLNEIKAQAIEEMADYYSNALIISVAEMRNYAKRLRGEK